ncbi:unnamed protein product [Paramecium pentaurelia]|uniref:Uncharacterized protein n=1 Tax=Paramecium pentaurelia TaxID=43138 RepID=A0A8S1T148_9CILI|nr:unnamed protein product [Paramecium pentaurelia]
MNYLLHSIRIIYPLIQSFKVLKNKDKEGQQTLLKYWCINWMISLLDIVLEIVLNDLLVDIVLISLAIGLIYNNFKFSAAIFNNSIQPFIYQHEKKIEQFFSFIDDKVKSVWDKSSNSLEHAAKEKIGEVVADQFKKK